MDKRSSSHALVRLDDPPATQSSVARARTQVERVRRWLVWIVFAAPLAIAFLYNFVVATPRYASEISFVVRSSETPHDRLSIVSLGQGGGIGTSDNSEAVVAFLKSRDILDYINRDGLVSRIFARDGIDPIARFPSPLAGDSREDFYRHFQNYVHSDFDRATDIIHVEVQSFAANDARIIAQRLLAASEQMVNRLNHRAQGAVVGGAQNDVAQASANLADVLRRMSDVRNRNHILEPELNAGSAIKLQSGTAAELAQIEVQLGQAIRAAPKSPLIGQLRARRSALEAQLNRQIGATAGYSGSLADRLRAYEELAARRDIAEKQMMAASLQLISAHDSVSRQQLYLEQIAQPNLPDEPRYPRRWLNLLLTALIAGCLLWIARSLAELVFDDE